jgi:hypothetical protein
MTEKQKWVILDDSFLTTPEPIEQPKKNFFSTDPIRTFREAIADLYDGFIMTKVSTSQGYGIYKAKIDSLSGNDTIKYIVAIVPNDTLVDIGSNIYLSGLPWINFQTRTTRKPKSEFGGFDLNGQQYSIKRDTILYDKIKLASEQETKHVYIPDHLPITVELLIQKEDESFCKEGMVITALELFQTIIILEI